jgi:hypothetical protein
MSDVGRGSHRRLQKGVTKARRCKSDVFGRKYTFGQPEILVVGYLCRAFGHKPLLMKVDAIEAIKDECMTQTEVRKFLGASAFYHIWIPHYAHVAEPLYGLLKKKRKFEWTSEHMLVIWWLKELLSEAPTLRKADYARGKPIFVTVHTSLTGIGWVINQEDEDDNRYMIRFGAKVLRERQWKHAHVKRELLGIVSSDRKYLIRVEVVIEIDCLPILGMVSGCDTPNITMLRWIAYIKSLNPEIPHIASKRNIVADMLSRARYEGG